MPGRPLVRARLGDRTANTHRRTPSARLDLRMAAHGELPHCWRAQPRNAPRRCTASFLAPSVYCPISGYICQVEQAQQRCGGTTAGRALALSAFSASLPSERQGSRQIQRGKVSSPLFAAHAGEPPDASQAVQAALGRPRKVAVIAFACLWRANSWLGPQSNVPSGLFGLPFPRAQCRRHFSDHAVPRAVRHRDDYCRAGLDADA